MLLISNTATLEISLEVPQRYNQSMNGYKNLYLHGENCGWEEKWVLWISVGFFNHLQYKQAAPTTDIRDRIARRPKCETSLAIITTPSIIDSAKLANETSVAPIRFALDGGIPVCRICAPTTSYDMCPNRDNTCQEEIYLCMLRRNRFIIGIS